MLRRIEIENFMSLRNVGVDLEPLTIFVGPNAAGKSAVFKALVTLAKLLGGTPIRGPRGDLTVEEGVTLDDAVWSGNSGLPIKFRVWFSDDPDERDGGEPAYTLEVGKRAAGWSVIREKIRIGDKSIEVDENHEFAHLTDRGDSRSWKPPLRAPLRHLVHPFVNDSAARPAIDPIIQAAERFGGAWRYRPSASDIASFVPPSRLAEQRVFYVQENGWGLAAVLRDLMGDNRDAFDAVERGVCRLFPHVKRIGFKNDRQGVRLTYTTDRSEDPVPAPQESDGVLLATFILWRLHTATPSLKICLEEPESGLHPHLLGDRYQLLKRFTSPDGGQQPVQILVATHSPYFLRTLKAHPTSMSTEIRIVDFDEDSGTSVKSISYREATQLLERYDDFGSLWLSGELGGIPKNPPA